MAQTLKNYLSVFYLFLEHPNSIGIANFNQKIYNDEGFL
ncbi:hypothetical protein SR187_7115 [Streptococcus ruminantium]|uniref:Uncharacterized protein n=1 Tax=Streptococcus ruminantium TaxID=1917441 RepID=A0A2Z5TPI9_9STRE|nr:hypothetical protein SR187_7115 [Streptococcus ruminantium]